MIKCKHVPPPVRYKHLAYTAAGIPQYTNEDDGGGGGGGSDDEDVCTNTLDYIYNTVYLAVSDKTVLRRCNQAYNRTQLPRAFRDRDSKFFSFTYERRSLFLLHSTRALSHPSLRRRFDVSPERGTV